MIIVCFKEKNPRLLWIHWILNIDQSKSESVEGKTNEVVSERKIEEEVGERKINEETSERR